ncbi:MAG: ArsC/Spx/MgsR family protein, partial [Myxococcota bacterium]
STKSFLISNYLAADGKLIKRPLIEGSDLVLVGFKEAEYEAALR